MSSLNPAAHNYAGMLSQSIAEAHQKLAVKKITKTQLADAFLMVARYTDWTLASSQQLPTNQPLVDLLKKGIAYKGDTELRPALMVLLLSAKAACHQDWFTLEDQTWLLKHVVEFWNLTTRASSFGPGNPVRSPNGPAVADVVSRTGYLRQLLQRFYPWLRLQKALTTLEAQTEYSVLACDFHLPVKLKPEERVRLFTARKDARVAAAAFATPYNVSFLINGEPVAGRTSVQLEKGAMPPSDVTSLVRVGPNLLQAVGLFPGPFICAVGVTTTVNFQLGLVPDYEEPAETRSADNEGEELVEGPWKISLKCPISFARIVSPSKGAHCRHRQCFDLQTFIESNRRVPAWRCPVCSRPVTYEDLRHDVTIASILSEPRVRADPEIGPIELSADGSWRPLSGEAEGSSKRSRAERDGHVDPPTPLELSDTEEEPRYGPGQIPVVELDGEEKPIANRFRQAALQASTEQPTHARTATAVSPPANVSFGHSPQAGAPQVSPRGYSENRVAPVEIEGAQRSVPQTLPSTSARSPTFFTLAPLPMPPDLTLQPRDARQGEHPMP